MVFEYLSRSVENMRNELIKHLPILRIFPASFYDTRTGRFRHSFDLIKGLGVVEVAELLVQRNGSAYEGYKSISKDPIRRLLAPVFGINPDNDLLIIGDDSELIVRPARLHLQSLIGYKSLDLN